MTQRSEKLALLQQHGFRYNFEREIYYNGDRKKVFSIEAVEDKPLGWLAEKIDEPTDVTSWSFYFNSTPSVAVQNELIAELSR